MSYFIPYLPSNENIDAAISSENEDRVTVIRFGLEWDQSCLTMDETLGGIGEKVQEFAVIYKVDLNEVPDCKEIYGLNDDPVTILFFYKNKHILIDLDNGNNGKINWAIDNKQELIDIIETVYRGASKNQPVGMKDYSQKYRY